MKSEVKWGIFLALVPWGWQELGLPHSVIVGLVLWTIAIWLWRSEIAGHIREIIIFCEIALCVLPISYFLWMILYKPLTSDARKLPLLPLQYKPPKSPPIERIPHALPEIKPPGLVTPQVRYIPAPKVEIDPAYGNLRDRCFEVVAKMRWCLQIRDYARP